MPQVERYEYGLFFVFVVATVVPVMVRADLPLTVENIIADKGTIKLNLSLAYTNGFREGVSKNEPVHDYGGYLVLVCFASSLMLVGVTRSYAQTFLSPEDVLSKKGQWQVGVASSVTFDQRLLIRSDPSTGGQVEVEDQEHRKLSSILELQYGLTSDIEIHAAVANEASWVNTRVGEQTTGVSEDEVTFEDARLGFTWQAVREVNHPAALLKIEAVLVERDAIEQFLHDYSGLRTFLVEATVYRQLDPVALSAGIGTQFGLKRKIKSVLFDPGDVVFWDIMATFAANERVSISTGMSWLVQGPLKINGQEQDPWRSHIMFKQGVSLALSESWTVSLAGSGGLTSTAPDSIVSLEVQRIFGH